MGYIKFGYKGEIVPKLLILFSTGFHWRIFLLSRANRLYAIFNTGLKKMASSCLTDIFLSSSPGVNGYGSVCHEPLPITDFLIFLFPLTGRSPYFRFRVPANHLASLSFSLGVRRPEVTQYQHLLISPL